MMLIGFGSVFRNLNTGEPVKVFGMVGGLYECKTYRGETIYLRREELGSS